MEKKEAIKKINEEMIEIEKQISLLKRRIKYLIEEKERIITEWTEEE